MEWQSPMDGSNDTEPLVSRKLVYGEVCSEVSETKRVGSDPGTLKLQGKLNRMELFTKTDTES